MHFKLWKIVLFRFDIYYYISISRVLLFHAYATDFDARFNAYWYSLFSSTFLSEHLNIFLIGQAYNKNS